MHGKPEKSSRRVPPGGSVSASGGHGTEGLEPHKERGDELFNTLISIIHQSGRLDGKTLTDMEESYGRLSDVGERYRYLVKRYRELRRALIESGNPMEAQLVKGRESLAKTSYYWYFGPMPLAFWSWLTGPNGLKHFGLLWCTLVFFIFPLLYWLGNLAVPITFSTPLTIADYVYFSACTATTLVYGDVVPIGLGKLIAVVEGLFSYFGLGLLFWTLMERFNEEI